jgi:hypothetical protein
MSLLLAAILAGCSDDARNARARSEERIERLLGLHPPFQVQGAGFMDDGGTGSARVFALGDTLDLYADNRSFRIPEAWTHLPADSFTIKMNTVEHHLWLFDYPDSPKASKLAFNSPAESAAIDLIRLAIASSYRPEEESLLVRAQRAARRLPHPDYEMSVLDSKLTPRQRDLRSIRQFLAMIEGRRAWAAGPP